MTAPGRRRLDFGTDRVDPNIAGKGYYRVPDIMTYLFTTKAVTDPGKRVLWAILNKTLRFGRCGYSIRNRDISSVTGIHQKNIGRYLRELEAKRIIQINGERIELRLNPDLWDLDTFTRQLVNERLGVSDTPTDAKLDEEIADEDDESEDSLLDSLKPSKLS